LTPPETFFEKRFLDFQKTFGKIQSYFDFVLVKVFGRFIRTLFSKRVLMPAERRVWGSAPTSHHTPSALQLPT
jgi:hypothetical protein